MHGTRTEKLFLSKNLNLSPNCFLWLCVKAKAKEVYIETRNNEPIVTKSMNKINNAVQTYWKLVFDNNSHSPTSFPTLDTKLVNCNFNREIHVWNYGVYYFWGYSSLSLSLICILFIVWIWIAVIYDRLDYVWANTVNSI